MNKKIILSGVGALLIGGGVAAYTLLNKTPKEAYFQAEMNTIETALEFFSERYEPEMNWYETQLEKPTETNLALSGNIDSYDEMASILNGATINVTALSDPKKSEAAVKLDASLFDIEIDGVGLYLTKDKIYAEVPFQEALELDLQNLGDFFEITTGDNMCLENVDIHKFIGTASPISEKDQTYIKETYGKVLFNSLPDKAFTEEDNKLTMSLKGSDIQKVLEDVLEKAIKDKKTQTIINELILLSDPCEKLDSKELLEEILSEVESTDFDFNIKSVIWTKDNIVVKRDLTIDTLQIKGEFAIDKSLTFDYSMEDKEYDEEFLTLKGKFGSGKNFEDEVTISSYGETILEYAGEESLNKNIRTFDRSVYLTLGYEGEFELSWAGETEYEGDSAIGEHEVSFSSNYTGTLGLLVETDSKVIKKIDVPSKSINLTDMSESELEDYFTGEFMNNFSDWAEDRFNGLEYLFY